MLLSLGPSSSAATTTDDPSPPTIGMPNCVTSCADVDVPYPFGLGTDPSCYLPGYNLTCDTTPGNARLLLDVNGIFQVMSISDSVLWAVRHGDIKIDLDADGNGKGMFSSGLMSDVPYTLANYGRTELILTGCNVQATVKKGNITVASCISLCGSFGAGPIEYDGTVRCSGGTGCCHGDIVSNDNENEVDSSSTSGYDVQLTWLGHGNRSADLERFPMRVFIADVQWFANSSISSDLLQTSVPPSEDTMAVPLFLYWEIVGDRRHCKSNHSERIDGRKGYTSCTCKQGFVGNPYLTDGCKAVNMCDWYFECYGECIKNKNGSMTCRCPPGTIGNHAIPGGCLAIVADTGEQI
uniref:Wall-associated receptor kinase galacturonan-binding domain-containing protein n=1 Tax=Hordeum vulgare subsp. vulgare TaxID=112509 RepID=A0A8I7BG93_HORVV